jgi:putative DNA primase/helicase
VTKPSNTTASDDDKVVTFPASEVTPEERARRLNTEVQRLSRLPTVEWMFYASREDHVQPFDVTTDQMRGLVEAVLRENQKKEREAKAEDRKREQRAEKQRADAQKKEERKREREQARVDKEAAKKEREKQKAFAALIKLPKAEHERRLVELATRLDEDLELLKDEFAALADREEERPDIGAIELWPDPVDTNALLTELLAQLQRYIFLKDDATIAIALWVMFAWIHDVAIHSPLLEFTSAEGGTGKTTACGVVKFLTPRAYAGTELTGPSLYRFVDHMHPTLVIDDADNLLPRHPDLAHIVNVSWTKGTSIPRQVKGETVWFDPFCPKVIAGVKLMLPRNTSTRTVTIRFVPKLPHEKVDDFSHGDDDTFRTLRRKLARWAADNAAALKDACPVLPPGFNNRLRINWRLQLAIADLASGAFPKAARTAALKLSRKRHQPSEGIRLLTALCPLLAAREEITSQEMIDSLNANPTGEWCEFRGRGPITQRQVAALLADYEIYPVVVHPTKRATVSRHGYRQSQFIETFLRYLPNDPNIRTLKREREKK